MKSQEDDLSITETAGQEGKPPREKRWWKVTQAIVGYLIPFLIIGSLPLAIWLISLSGDAEPTPDEDPQPSQKERRREELDENLEDYQNRAEELGYSPIDFSIFEPALCPFGDHPESWNETKTPEEAGFICGYVHVPLDHDQPAGDIILVAVAIWPTYDEPHFSDPLFITQGGPGASTLSDYPEYIYPDRTGGERDLVFVEQRGTHYSYPNLNCSYTDWEEGLPESDDPGDYEYIDFLSSCRADLLDEGIDLEAFTSPQIARDFEVVRQALGYDQINFYGVSYGTLVGQYLAAYYPESVRSLILDGVVTLPLDFLNDSLERIDRVLTELAASCQDDPACANSYPDLIDRFDDLIQEMEAEPREIQITYPDDLFPSGDTLDGETFYYFFLHMFYLDHSFAFLPYIMEQAEKGNFDLFETMTEWMLEGDSGDSGLYYSVICSEHDYFADIPDGASHLVTAGIDWEGDTRQEFRDICAMWDVGQTPDRLEDMPASEIPTLLMSGQFDPVTPPENGDEVLASFRNGQHLVDPVGGHGVIFSDSCTKKILKDFLNMPDQAVDADCLSDEDRRTQAVPSSAVSSPFMIRIMSSDSAYPLMLLTPILMILLMILRSAGSYFGHLWRSVRGKPQVLDEKGKRLRLRYELVTWTVVIASFGLAVGFTIYFDRAYNVPSFLYALAMPMGIRLVLNIPWPLMLILPLALFEGVRMYIHFPSILKRVRILFQAAYCLSVAGFLIWSGLLLAAIR